MLMFIEEVSIGAKDPQTLSSMYMERNLIFCVVKNGLWGFICSLMIMINDIEYHFKLMFYILYTHRNYWCLYLTEVILRNITLSKRSQRQAKAEYCGDLRDLGRGSTETENRLQAVQVWGKGALAETSRKQGLVIRDCSRPFRVVMQL